MSGALLVALLVAQPPGPVATPVAEPPTYLVERIVRVGEKVRRVSVFRDGTAVLALRDGGGPPTVRRRRLGEVVFRSLRQVVEETYPGMRDAEAFRGTPGEGAVELRLAPPGRSPVLVTLSLTAASSVAAARLGRAIDDVDALLSELVPGQEDLSRWTPQVGERVLLDDGAVAVVLEVLVGGTVVHVRLGDGPAEVFFDLDELRRRCVRLLAP